MCKSKRGIKREDGGKVRSFFSIFFIVDEVLLFQNLSFPVCLSYNFRNESVSVFKLLASGSAGRIQVATPVDWEKTERQDQRMYWPAEGFVTGTPEAVGELSSNWCVQGMLWNIRNGKLSAVLSQTLGHLEKAVVLELTLKHLNALTAVTEQQHQKIVALQNGKRLYRWQKLGFFSENDMSCSLFIYKKLLIMHASRWGKNIDHVL